MLLRRICLFCVLAVVAANRLSGRWEQPAPSSARSPTAPAPSFRTSRSPSPTRPPTPPSTRRAILRETSTRHRCTPVRIRFPRRSPASKKSVTDTFTLAVDQKIRINLSLKPGAVTETLEVAAQAVNLDTDTAALSQEMSGDQVAALPLNGRNFMQLLLVGAGAVTVGGEQGTMRQGEGNAVSINGGRPEGNNYTLDGLVNTDQALQTPAVILSQDAIGEFKVQSGIYPAENGFGASQVNIVTKGGTNSLHGAISSRTATMPSTPRRSLPRPISSPA